MAARQRSTSQRWAGVCALRGCRLRGLGLTGAGRAARRRGRGGGRLAGGELSFQAGASAHARGLMSWNPVVPPPAFPPSRSVFLCMCTHGTARGACASERCAVAPYAGVGGFGGCRVCGGVAPLALRAQVAGRKVAIKKVKDVFRNLTDAKRILRELKLLRHLGGHENIIWILDIMVRMNGGNGVWRGGGVRHDLPLGACSAAPCVIPCIAGWYEGPRAPCGGDGGR